MKINQLYERYSKHLFFTSLRITGNSALAEEAMQDAFIKYHLLKDKESIENPEAWLIKSAVRNSIDLIRKEQRGKRLQEEFAAEAAEPIYRDSDMPSAYGISDLLNQPNLIEEIKSAIAALPRAQRIAVSLRLLEGFDYEEIAQITGVEQKSIRSNYMRGRERIAQYLKSHRYGREEILQGECRDGESGAFHKRESGGF